MILIFKCALYITFSAEHKKCVWKQRKTLNSDYFNTNKPAPLMFTYWVFE